MDEIYVGRLINRAPRSHEEWSRDVDLAERLLNVRPTLDQLPCLLRYSLTKRDFDAAQNDLRLALMSRD